MATEPDLVVSAGFSDAQLVREANKVVAHFRKRGEEAQKAFQDAQGRVSNSQAARAHTRELDRLAKAYDPAYRAARRYEDEVKRLDRALDLGAISQQQYTAEVVRAAQQMKRASAAVEDTAQGSRRFGGSLQQVGYQVGDFATQVGAGTSATQALGQQLPQLLGAFGTFGALAGAAAAITIPLGAALFRMSGESKTAEESLDELSKATDAYSSVADLARRPIADLREEFGDLADEIQRVSGIQAGFLRQLAQRNLTATAGLISGSFGGLSGDADGDAISVIGTDLEQTMRKLRGLFNGNRDAVGSFAAALRDLDRAEGPEDVVASVEALQTVIADFALSGQEVAPELEAFFSDLTSLSEQAAEQISNSLTAQERAWADLTEKYGKDTEQLRALAGDRTAAEEALAQAVKDGNAEKIRAAEEYIRVIDREIAKTREAAAANDSILQSRIRAYESYGESRRQALAVTGSAIDVIKDFEGFRSTPYWDVNAYRGGFGSDTVTLADGSVQKVVQGMTISIADANRDLVRRVGEFQQGIIGRIGSDRFDNFTREQQAALTSIAYNYGSLPDRIIESVRTGSPEDIANSIARLAGDNGGVNEDRRLREASAFGGASVARADLDAAKATDKDAADELKKEVRERERLAKQAKDYGDQLAASLITQQQAAVLAKDQAAQVAAIKTQGLDPEAEARAIALVTAEIEKQRTVMALYADAKRRNVDLDAMLADGTMTYRQAIEALGQAKRDDIIATQERAIAEERAAEAQKFMADQQQAVEQGLVRAIVAGESFTDVLGRVAQAFAEAAIQAALFNSGPWASGSGSGLLGSLFSGFFGGGSVKSADGGGFTGLGPRSGGIDGKGGFPAVLHPNETVIDHTRGQSGGSRDVRVTVSVDQNGNLQAFVDRRAEGKVQQGIASYDKAIPMRVQQTRVNPRKR